MRTILGIITRSSDILIGKIKTEKAEDYGGLTYAFPSGQLDDNESAEDLTTKEVKEQLNLDINIVSKIGERLHPTTGNWIEYYHCVSNDYERIQLSKDADIEEFLWIAIHSLTDYMPTLYTSVKTYLENI